MTDERFKRIAEAGGCDMCDGLLTECTWEIRRLREENERMKRAVDRHNAFLDGETDDATLLFKEKERLREESEILKHRIESGRHAHRVLYGRIETTENENAKLRKMADATRAAHRRGDWRSVEDALRELDKEEK
jgi:hypothetical protein